jgi:hypothetical protein
MHTNKVQRVNECKRIFSRGGGQSRNFQCPRISNHRSWNTFGQADHPSVPTTYRSLSTKALAGARHALRSRGVRCTRLRRRSPPVAQMSRVRQSRREWHLATHLEIIAAELGLGTRPIGRNKRTSRPLPATRSLVAHNINMGSTAADEHYDLRSGLDRSTLSNTCW